MDEDEHEGLLISDRYDINDPHSNTYSEYLISTTELEIVNDGESVTSIIDEEENNMFPEGARLM